MTLTPSEAKAELTDIYNNALEYKDSRTKCAFDMALDLLSKQEQGLVTVYDSKEVKDSVDEAIELYNKKAQGLIIELPIPLGATVYCISPKGPEVFSWDVTFAHIKWLKENFGIRAFDTKEKALARLKELRGEKK